MLGREWNSGDGYLGGALVPESPVAPLRIYPAERICHKNLLDGLESSPEVFTLLPFGTSLEYSF